MELESIDTEGQKGEEYISDGIKHIISDPYGMQPGKGFYLYLPGIDIASLPEEYYMWVSGPLCLEENVQSLPCYGLYNEEAATGFFQKKDINMCFLHNSSARFCKNRTSTVDYKVWNNYTIEEKIGKGSERRL